VSTASFGGSRERDGHRPSPAFMLEARAKRGEIHADKPQRAQGARSAVGGMV